MRAAKLLLGPVVATAFLGTGIASLQAKPQAPIVLAHTSKWVIDYDDDSCIVASAFGSDAQRMVVRLTWFAPGDQFQLILSGKTLPRRVNGEADILFGPGFTAVRHTGALAGTNSDVPLVVMASLRLDGSTERKQGQDLPDITPDQEKAVEWIDLRLGSQRWHLATGSLGAIMAAKRACTRDLVKAWGYDPAVQETLSRHAAPIGSAAGWLTTSDFPSDALDKGANGIVQFRLDVDAGGKVTACHVLKGIRSPDFDRLTCDAIRRRARLDPALDARGKPTPSFYVNRVTWLTG